MIGGDARRLHIGVDANVLEANWGGIPKNLDRIARELAGPFGDRVDLLVNLRSWATAIPGATPVPMRVKGRPLWRDLGVPLWAARRRPDVFWAPEGILPRWLPVPSVVTIHDLAPLLFPGSKPAHVERAYKTTMPRSARAADRVICVSQATADDVVAQWGVARSRIRVISNGIDETFTPGDRSAAAATVRERFGVEAPFVLHVGSLEPRKGLDVLFAAATRGAWRLVLAGSPAFDGQRLVAEAEKVGAALLRGVGDDDLLALYRAADAVVAPALYEGFGIVPLEAMACGTPAVIATGAGALEEVSGPAAVSVSARTAEAWLTGIESARRRRSELAGPGIEHAARFRWPDIAAATRAVLAEAADR